VKSSATSSEHVTISITFDRPKLERLKKAYAKVKSDDIIFTFDGRDYLGGYAKYVIAYLETQLRGR